MGLPTESDIVYEAKAGSRQAFERLVERYQTAACSLAYAFTGSFAHSEEIAQEAFITVWRRLPELRDPGGFRPWLYGIIRNISLHFRRSQRSQMSLRGAAVAVNDITPAPPSPLERVISREEEQVLWRALEEVPESYRIPLILFYREDQSIERIADALDLSEENVRQRLKRGRQRLQQAVTPLLEAALVGTRPGKDLTGKIMAAVALVAAGRAEAAPGGKGVGKTALRKSLMVAGAAAVGLVAAVALRGAQPAHPPDGKARTGAPGVPSLLSANAGAARRLSSASAAAGGAFSILDFDFEDGLLPSLFITGHVVPAPAGASSRFCLMLTISPFWPDNPIMDLESTDKPLFVYSDGGAISFDYWLGDDNFREVWNSFFRTETGSGESKDGWELIPISFEAWDRDAEPRKFGHYVYDYATERWGHLEVPLSLFKGKDPSRLIQSGDRIVRLSISGGQAGGKPFYVDNLKFIAR